MPPRSDPVRVLLLAVFAALAIPSLRAESPTWDEPYHLAQGFRYLRTGDASFRHEQHPPGFQALAALPLVILGVPLEPLPATDPRSSHEVLRRSSEFVAANSGRVLQLFPLARGVVLLVAMGLGWLMYDAAARTYGRSPARFALALFVFDPNLIAHGRLVTTDMAAAFSSWLVLTALVRWGRSPGLARAAWIGLALGWALVSKFSTLILAVWLLPLGAILVARRRPGIPIRALLRDAGLVYLLAFTVLWGIHGFAVGPAIPLDEPHRPVGQDEARDANPRRPLAGWTLPAPTYFQGVAQVVGLVYERGHTAYLCGKHSRKGWTEYFPIVLAIKSPLPTLLLVLAALASFLAIRPRREEWMWLAFVAITLAAAIRGSLNLGYRHVLPILPPLFLLASRLVSTPVLSRLGPGRQAVHRAVIIVLLAWLVVGTVRQHRHPLAYFNEIVGGPRNGWRYLVDANLDWGQDLSGLSRWLHEHRVENARISYFGSVTPSLYGIRWLPIQFPGLPPGRKPDPDDIPAGVYAVSVSNMVELQTFGRGPLTVFQELEPVATIGHSIRVFVVP